MQREAAKSGGQAPAIPGERGLGTFGFGGPIALAGHMQREVAAGVAGLARPAGSRPEGMTPVHIGEMIL